METDLVVGSTGTSEGQFSYPRAMCVAPGPNGPSVVVIDKTARVQRFDASTGALIGWFRMPEWKFGKPTGVHAGPDPADPSRTVLYIADTHYHRVMVYDLPVGAVEPEPLYRFGEYGTEPGQFVYVTDVEPWVGQDGQLERVYVGEYGGNDRVTAFDVVRDDEGVHFKPAFTFGHFGTPGIDGGDEPMFNRPQHIEADPARGELVIADAINHRVGRFTPEGELIAWLGGWSDETGDLVYPYSVAVLDDGSLLVSEFGGGRVRWMSRETGEILGTYGRAGRAAGELAQPWEVVVAGRTAWVLDSGNNRFMRFKPPRASGTYDADGRAR